MSDTKPVDPSINQYLADPSTSRYAHCNNFFDWFCSDNALVRKQKALDAKVRKLAKSKLVDPDKMYVFYKNNCPVRGPIYDDIRICDMVTGDVVFTVTPKSGHTGKAEVHGPSNMFMAPLASGTWKEVLAFFGV